MTKEEALEQWLEGKPEKVKALIRKYPPNTEFIICGTTFYCIGTNDDGTTLLITPIQPSIYYETTVAFKVEICECHFDKLDKSRIKAVNN